MSDINLTGVPVGTKVRLRSGDIFTLGRHTNHEIYSIYISNGTTVTSKGIVQRSTYPNEDDVVAIVTDNYTERLRACLVKRKANNRAFANGDLVRYNGAAEEGRKFERPDVGTFLKVLHIGLDGWPECISQTGKRYGFPPHTLNHA